jgi:branched-chain amino acid aminotransferase
MHRIRIASRAERSTLPPPDSLGFGRFFSDHMFRARYQPDLGWHDAAVVARAPLALGAASSVLHYGQSVFEGLKAFARPEGRVALFRPDAHAERFVASARRVCLPEVPPALFRQAVDALTWVDRDFVPRAPETALYLRPTLIGTEAFLGVRPSTSAEFFIIASPVGSYWQGGRRPLKLWVETELCRAAPGGIGAAKTGGNYAASLLAAERAKARGFDQVLWLDAPTRSEVEEVGTMNVFVRVGETVLTPPLNGSILAGITRDSVITLLREQGVDVQERSITLAEIEEAHDKGTLAEVFGTGTGGLIAPVGVLGLATRTLTVGAGSEGEITTRLYDELRAIQYGQRADRHRWLTDVARPEGAT